MSVIAQHRKTACSALIALCLLVGQAVLAQGSAPSDKGGFDALLMELASGKFKRQMAAIEAAVEVRDNRIQAVLDALASRNLYFNKRTREVAIRSASDSAKPLVKISDGAVVAVGDKRRFRRVKANNRVRGRIKDSLAFFGLLDADPDIRLAAAKRMETVSGDSMPRAKAALEAALEDEQDKDVIEAIGLSIATLNLNAPDESVRIAALGSLENSLEPAVLTLVKAVVDDPDRSEQERSVARSVLENIETRRTVYSVLETAYFGISLGSVLLLAAIGLAITFGVMGVINMAHGEMVMLGAYTTYAVQAYLSVHVDYSLWIALPAAFLITALVGLVLERVVIRHLYGRPLETLLATFGISLVLQQAVRTIFSPLNRSVETPSWMSGALEINPVFALTYNRLYIIVFALIVLATLMLALKHSRFGLEMRAVTQNRAMARAMGIRSARVDAMTFALGSGIAGLAGVALSQLTNVGPNMGQAYIVDSFMVVVFGGVGNLLGTLVGAMSLGVVNKVLEPMTGAVLAKALVLVFIILFIQFRPRGLFALTGRAAE
jgi:urea transport system permease protein